MNSLGKVILCHTKPVILVITWHLSKFIEGIWRQLTPAVTGNLTPILSGFGEDEQWE